MSDRVAIGLAEPPRVRLMGVAVHGASPVERYRMQGLWCLHAYRYRARLRIEDEWFELRPGHVSIIPPETEMEYRFQGQSEHVFVHFAMEQKHADRNSDVRSIALVQTLGRRAGGFDAEL